MNNIKIVLVSKIICLDLRNVYFSISKLKALKILKNKLKYNNSFNNNEIIYSINIIIN